MIAKNQKVNCDMTYLFISEDILQKLISTLLDKLPTTTKQMIKYGLVAAVGLVVDFSLVIFTKEILHFYYLLAVCSGFILGLVVTYLLSNKFVFGSPRDSFKKSFALFGLIGLAGLGILSLLMWILTGKLGINYIIAKALATIVVFAWNFFARKTLYNSQEL